MKAPLTHRYVQRTSTAWYARSNAGQTNCGGQSVSLDSSATNMFGRHAFLSTLFWGQMGVHGRDERAFWLNGTPWFFDADVCSAEKDVVKPANFRAPGMVVLTDSLSTHGKLQIESRYFALAAESAGYTCREIDFQPQLAGGRVTFETADGIEERDYDFYIDEWAFWFGPPLNDRTPEGERYGGHLVVPRAMRGGLKMDGVPWYAAKANCLAALAKKPKARRP